MGVAGALAVEGDEEVHEEEVEEEGDNGGEDDGLVFLGVSMWFLFAEDEIL